MSQVIDELDDDDDVALQRKNRDESEMDITPMIDIVFLLLIFFVVCSKMDPVKMGAIPDADNGTPISANDSAVIYIEPAGPDKVILSKADGTALSSDEETQAAQLVEYIDQELKTTIGKPKNHVMIMGNAEVRVGEVTRVQKIIGDNFPDVTHTYIAVRER